MAGRWENVEERLHRGHIPWGRISKSVGNNVLEESGHTSNVSWFTAFRVVAARQELRPLVSASSSVTNLYDQGS